MTGKLIGSSLLLAAVAAAQLATAKSGGIQADLLSLGAQGNRQVTASVKITNTNKDQMAYVLVMGPPSATDDGGGTYMPAGQGNSGKDAVGGVAYCPGPPGEPRSCVGVPKVDENLFPPEMYTEIEPDNSVIMQVHMGAPTVNRTQYKISLTFAVAYRLTKQADAAKDADIPQYNKLHSLHFASLGFPPVMPNQQVNSTIK